MSRRETATMGEAWPEGAAPADGSWVRVPRRAGDLLLLLLLLLLLCACVSLCLCICVEARVLFLLILRLPVTLVCVAPS